MQAQALFVVLWTPAPDTRRRRSSDIEVAARYGVARNTEEKTCNAKGGGKIVGAKTFFGFGSRGGWHALFGIQCHGVREVHAAARTGAMLAYTLCVYAHGRHALRAASGPVEAGENSLVGARQCVQDGK